MIKELSVIVQLKIVQQSFSICYLWQTPPVSGHPGTVSVCAFSIPLLTTTWHWDFFIVMLIPRNIVFHQVQVI